MARKMSAKQIAIFGTKAQKAALKRRRGGVRRSRSSAPRRAPKRSPHMARRKSRSGGKKQKQTWTDMAVTANVVIQAAEPFIPAGAAALAGDVPGAISAAKPALKEAASAKNIGQMAIPFVARGVARKLTRMFGVRSPKVGGRRLF